jgi:hypothetical protein
MSLRQWWLLIVLAGAAAALAACSLGPNPARATLQASVTPPPSPTASATYPPTATEYPPTSTATATVPPTPRPSATPTGATEAASPTAGTDVPATAGASVDKAEFVADVTVPDGATFTPGEAFVKTWRVKNAGTTTWTSDYVLAFVRGEQMGGPQTVPMPASVAPGETVELSVNLTAPQRLGAFTGFWQFRTPAGQPFGIGPEANQPVYVQINVTVDANGSPVPTVAAGALNVTGATMSVDKPSITGVCPQSFVFSAALTSEGAGAMTYRLEAAADTPGFTFNLPETTQSTFTGAGPRTFNASYTLEFTGSVSGQMWVHILSPVDQETNKVSFSLTCTPAGP